jgi:hypothetical protein
MRSAVDAMQVGSSANIWADTLSNLPPHNAQQSRAALLNGSNSNSNSMNNNSSSTDIQPPPPFVTLGTHSVKHANGSNSSSSSLHAAAYNSSNYRAARYGPSLDEAAPSVTSSVTLAAGAGAAGAQHNNNNSSSSSSGQRHTANTAAAAARRARGRRRRARGTYDTGSQSEGSGSDCGSSAEHSDGSGACSPCSSGSEDSATVMSLMGSCSEVSMHFADHMLHRVTGVTGATPVRTTSSSSFVKVCGTHALCDV